MFTQADGVGPRRTTLLAEALRFTWSLRPGLLVATAALAVIGGLMPVGATRALGAAVDAGDSDQGWRWPVAVLILFVAGQQIIPPVNRAVSGYLGRAFRVGAKAATFGRVVDLPGLTPFYDPSFHNEVTLAHAGAEHGPADLVDGIGEAIGSFAALLGFTLILMGFEPLVLPVLAFGGIATFSIEYGLARRQVRSAERITEPNREQIFFEMLSSQPAAAQEVRAYRAQWFFKSRYESALRRVIGEERRLEDVTALMRVGRAALEALTVAAILVVVFGLRRGPAISSGETAVAITGSIAAVRTVVLLAENVGRRIDSLDRFGHLQRLLNRPPDLVVSADGTAPDPLEQMICFEDVWFRYDDRAPWALAGLNLHVRAGESLAIVGRNGAGKSTLVKLMARLYDPERGRITWDGVDIVDLDLDAYRDRLSVMFQDFMSYDLSAAENIAMTDQPHDREALIAASEWAGMDTTLAGLNQGYDTLLSKMFGAESFGTEELGTELSGGQWQRVALARLRFNVREIVIADEPTAALDPEVESAVLDKLLQAAAGRTSLIVTHRLGTVRDVDRIAVLDGGRVVELGPHVDLLAADGLYARLFELQSSRYQASS